MYKHRHEIIEQKLINFSKVDIDGRILYKLRGWWKFALLRLFLQTSVAFVLEVRLICFHGEFEGTNFVSNKKSFSEKSSAVLKL